VIEKRDASEQRVLRDKLVHILHAASTHYWTS